MIEPCAAYRDQGFQTHGSDIQGDKQPVETPAEMYEAQPHPLTTLPHKLVLLSHPKCGREVKNNSEKKGGLADWHIQTSSGVRDKAKAPRLLIS